MAGKDDKTTGTGTMMDGMMESMAPFASLLEM